MASLVKIKPQIENVPDALKKHKQWIVWKSEVLTKKDGSKKLTKIPHNPKTGSKASTKERSHWGTFDQAADAYMFGTGYAGLGFVFTEDDSFIGVDLDNCFDEDGGLRADAEIAINTLKSFTERSPSGNGLHIICEGELPGSGHCDHANGREMYQEGRFFTITADLVGDYHQINEAQESVNALYEDWFGQSSYDEVKSGELNDSWDLSASITPLDQMPISESMKALVHDEEGINKYDNDRSVAIFAVCREMLYAGVNVESILTCLSDKEHSLSGAALERRRNNVFSAQDWLWKYSLGKVVARKKEEGDMFDDIGDDEAFNEEDLVFFDSTDNSKAEKNKTTEKEHIPYVKGNYELNARLFMKAHSMFRENQQYHYWNGKYYEAVSDEFLEGELQHCMGGRDFPISNINDCAKTIKRLSGRMKNKLKKRPHMINFLNGMLDVRSWQKGEHDFKFMKHSPKYDIRGVVKFNYDPDAKCPYYMKFASQVYQGDAQSINVTEQFTGYCMIEDYRHQVFFNQVGVSRSGKGLYAKIANMLVGDHYFAAATLSSLAGEHGLSLLRNAKLAIIGEAKHGKKSDIPISGAVILSITGNDQLPVNRKHKDLESVRLIVRLWLQCNVYPAFPDPFNALRNRALIVDHKVSFAGAEDPLLEFKLMKELPGIANVMLRQLVQLGKQGKFIQPEAAIDKRNEILLRQNPVGYFVDNYLIRTDNNTDRVTKEEMFDAFCNMQNVTGCPTREYVWFGREFKGNADWIKDGKVATGDSGLRKNCYKGVKLDMDKLADIFDD